MNWYIVSWNFSSKDTHFDCPMFVIHLSGWFIRRLSGSHRACADGEGGGGTGAGLCAGAAAGRGGVAESLRRISCSSACTLAISPLVCCCPAANSVASWSTLWRTAARPSASRCISDEVATAGATASGAVCALRPNQASCGDELAIIARAASPYDCQAKVVLRPAQKMINKEASLRNARFASDGRLGWTTGDPFIASSEGLA